MIYFNNAATTWPKPDIVIESVNNCILNIPQEEERYGFADSDLKNVSWSRNKVKEFFNVEYADNIIFNSGATEGLNTVLYGLDIKKSNIISSVIEHNSVLRPLHILSEDNTVTFINCDEYGFISTERIEENIQSNTRVLIMSAASNVTGAIQDINTIYDICIKNSIIPIFDASQAGGCTKIDIKKYNQAFWIFTGHKSLFGLSGSGFMYIPDNIVLRSYKSGGTGILSELHEMPQRLPVRYEAGTKNIPGIISIGSGIEFIQNTGFENIILKKRDLLELLFSKLSENSKIKIFSAPADRNAGVFCFSMSEYDSEELSDMLYESFGIISRSGLHCSPDIHKRLGTYENGLVRISLSWFNNREDVIKLISAINNISGVQVDD
jgi:cysteine desulfurase family protein